MKGRKRIHHQQHKKAEKMEGLPLTSSSLYRDLLHVGYLPPRQSVEYNHHILAWTLTIRKALSIIHYFSSKENSLPLLLNNSNYSLFSLSMSILINDSSTKSKFKLISL